MDSAAFRAEVRAFVAGLVPPGWTGIGALPGDEAAAFPAHAPRQCLQAFNKDLPARPRSFTPRGAIERLVLTCRGSASVLRPWPGARCRVPLPVAALSFAASSSHKTTTPQVAGLARRPASESLVPRDRPRTSC